MNIYNNYSNKVSNLLKEPINALKFKETDSNCAKAAKITGIALGSIALFAISLTVIAIPLLIIPIIRQWRKIDALEMRAPASPSAAVAAAVDQVAARVISPQSALGKYAVTTLNKPAEIAVLKECLDYGCAQKHDRLKIEPLIYAHVADKSKDEEITLASLGSGKMQQEWRVVANLILRGHRNFRIHLIDEVYSDPKPQIITFSSNPGNVPGLRFSEQNNLFFTSKSFRDLRHVFTSSLLELAEGEGINFRDIKLSVEMHSSVTDFKRELGDKKVTIATAICFPFTNGIDAITEFRQDLQESGGFFFTNTDQEYSDRNNKLKVEYPQYESYGPRTAHEVIPIAPNQKLV